MEWTEGHGRSTDDVERGDKPGTPVFYEVIQGLLVLPRSSLCLRLGLKIYQAEQKTMNAWGSCDPY